MDVDELVIGDVYAIRSRNLAVAVLSRFDPEDKYPASWSFIGIREKFRDRFLDTEYMHPGATGTVSTVVVRLSTIPQGIGLRCRFDKEVEDCPCGHDQALHSREYGKAGQGAPGVDWSKIACWLCSDNHSYGGERYLRDNRALFQYLELFEDAAYRAIDGWHESLKARA